MYSWPTLTLQNWTMVLPNLLLCICTVLPWKHLRQIGLWGFVQKTQEKMRSVGPSSSGISYCHFLFLFFDLCLKSTTVSFLSVPCRCCMQCFRSTWLTCSSVRLLSVWGGCCLLCLPLCPPGALFACRITCVCLPETSLAAVSDTCRKPRQQ